ncbi:transaldolase [Nocardioides astragali]|uniref:Transaldolase n=1 Tax=Nocardioides astragali TaxID=1776736 RepID=A0ABW2N139_9ACTN|nr:transaldolase [Nocardioides astragali]
MSQLQQLHAEQGQSPWLDNLTREDLSNGRLAHLVADGIRGVTANPTIVAKAIESSDEYDEQFASLVTAGRSTVEAYWELVASDVSAACAVLRPVHDDAGGMDGFVSVEVAPDLAGDTERTIRAARRLHQRIDEPNLMVKIPATAQGVPAIEAMTAEGRNITVTLIFSLSRYAEVIDAYLAGLESFVTTGGDPAQVHSVASFFVSRVDTEVDRRLEAHRGASAAALRGRAAVAQAKLAYQMFQDCHCGSRWERLATLGAHPQLPLWASTSPKDPGLRDTDYVDELIGPRTITTLAEATVDQFEDHGVVARTVDTGAEEARDVVRRLADLHIDLDDVGLGVEQQGVEKFRRSYQGVLEMLDAKVHQLDRI